ncbi:MAG: hypothetical protein ABIP94_06500, partial [Planctomycetota bacterium]
LAADLRAFLTGMPVTARPPTWLQRGWRWGKREPWRASALATAVAAALVLMAVTFSFTNKLLAENASTKQALLLAEHNFAKATEAVDEMLTRVGDRELAEIPQMEAVRRHLLQRALAFYEGFAVDRAADREVAFQLARARARVAWIQAHLSEEQLAADAAIAAIAEFDALLAATPGAPDVLLERAEAQLALGEACYQQGKADAAQGAYADIVATIESVTVPPALEQSRRRKVALAHYGIAHLLRFRDQERSHANFEQASSELAWLFDRAPDDAHVAGVLVNTRFNLSRMALGAGDSTAAEALLQQVGHDLTRAPDSLAVSIQRCSIHGEWAHFYQETGRLPDAAAAQTLAVRAWQKLVASFPDTPSLRDRLSQAWSNLSNLRRYLGQEDDAVAATREAIGLAEQLVARLPEVAGYRSQLGRSLMALGSMLVRNRDSSGHAEGLAVLARALDLADRLRHDEPDQAEHARLAADCLCESGYVEGLSGNHAEARVLYERAAQVWSETVARHPQETAYQDGHANVLVGAAGECIELDDPVNALATLDRGLTILRSTLAKDARRPARRRYMRNGLATRLEVQEQLGNHAAACADLIELTTFSDSAKDAETAVAKMAKCLGSAPQGEHDRYVDAVITAIATLADLGRADARAIAADTRFAAVRENVRFKEVLQRIGRQGQ